MKVVCELESIDLWGYAESNTPMLGPFEGLSMRQGKELKRWLCPRELVFSDCGFPDFEEAKKALLGAAPAKNSSVTWEGIAALSWSTATGKSTAPPRCPRLVDPAAILSQIRPGNEQTIVSSLWERHGRWSAVLDGVSGAQDVWLDVAERLRPGTDAGSAEEIDMAIGEAFMRAPEKVLRRFGPQDICHTLGFADQSDLDQEKVFALLKRRRALAEAIDASDLAVARAACLAELDKLQAELDEIHR